MLKSNNNLSKFKNREEVRFAIQRIVNYDESTGLEEVYYIPCINFHIKHNCYNSTFYKNLDSFLEIIAFEAENGININ